MRIDLEEKLVKPKSNLLFALSVFWFAVRVMPKPSRIVYPCQRTTLSLIFVRLGIGLSTICITFTELAQKKLVKVLLMLMLFIGIASPAILEAYYAVRYSMIGRGRIEYNFLTNNVIRVHSTDATSWDFGTGYYWQYVNQSVVDRMVEEGVKALTGNSTAEEAWQTIMLNYTSGNKIGIKINGNDWWNSDQREIDSLPQLTNSIIKGLKSIGVPETDIYIIENTHVSIAFRVIPTYYTDIITQLYPNVVFQYDFQRNPSYGSISGTEVNFPYTNPRRINDEIASVDHLILIPIMKAITPNWGITGTIKLMQGVIEDVSSFHQYLTRTTDNPNVLMYQNQHIIGKTRLIVGDGIFGAWTGQHFTGGYGGVDNLNTPVNDIPKPWITFDNGAPNSLFFGVDPVAIDCVMYDNILSERNAQDQVSGQSLAPFNEPQLISGENNGLGIREHGPPYSNINYLEIEL